MLKDIVQAEYLDGYRLRLSFEDGVVGIVDVSKLITFTGVFSVCADIAYFAQVYVDPDLGTICWPNGAGQDPDVLYSVITGEPIDIAESVGRLN